MTSFALSVRNVAEKGELVTGRVGNLRPMRCLVPAAVSAVDAAAEHRRAGERQLRCRFAAELSAAAAAAAATTAAVAACGQQRRTVLGASHVDDASANSDSLIYSVQRR